jgi:cytidine deaminase
MDIGELFARALEASRASYSPYSRFRVGAALICEDGSVFSGTNVENRSFGLTTCAERNALVAAVGAGRRSFSAIAIATPDSDYPVSPCGACRQVLSEFMGPGATIAFGPKAESLVVTTMGELFPYDALHELGKHQ